MFKPLLAALALSACATTGATTYDRDNGPHARVQLDLARVNDSNVTRQFPAVIDPQLPSADRIANRIRRFGAPPTTHVELCVAPDGHVASLRLERASTLPSYDQAVMHDAASWQFARLPAQSCEHAAISYRPS
jgi:outer membrane biosynthesis protein TonB